MLVLESLAAAAVAGAVVIAQISTFDASVFLGSACGAFVGVLVFDLLKKRRNRRDRRVVR